MSAQILCIEDDPDIALAIRMVLVRAGFEVTAVLDGRDGLRVFHSARPDAVLLDIGLPTMAGWDVLERIRESSDVPVLMLTAHGQLSEKVRGLSAGADDYLAKPFGNAELVARVSALLRRRRSGRADAEVYDDGRLQVAFGSGQVRVDDELVELTEAELSLLAELVRQPGQTVAVGQLVDAARGSQPPPSAGQVHLAARQLSRKLGDDPGAGPRIEEVGELGYRYQAP